MAAALALVLLLQQPIQAQNLLQIRVIEGEGLVRPAGASDGRGIAVQITDETGRPVENAVVSFRLPEEGPGGTFPRGLRTEIVNTTGDGRAAVYGIAWNRQPGPFQIRVTAVKGTVRAGTVVSQYISDAPAARKAKGSGAGKNKWLIVGLVVAGGAAGASVGILGRSKEVSQPPTSTTTPSLQIGLPTITIGGGN